MARHEVEGPSAIGGAAPGFATACHDMHRTDPARALHTSCLGPPVMWPAS